MLTRTFSHLPGISKARERELWLGGVLDWEGYKAAQRQIPLPGMNRARHQLSESEGALERGDMAFFRDRLPGGDLHRVALAFPREVMFLDIETTGLSLYYDQITLVGWSIGGRYGALVPGDAPDAFLRALKEAKALVTYNGKMFDCKFIAKHYGNPPMPAIHIDLRFFAKRVGLTGGQKAIERELGLRRDAAIDDMQGEAAPILWHKYRRGDNAALERLIKYNHADIEGMKGILDESIRRYYDAEDVPASVRAAPPFSALGGGIKWAREARGAKGARGAEGARKKAAPDPYRIRIRDFKGNVKPLITYGDLDKIRPLGDFCVAGIDLVSSATKETGYCILRGNVAETCRLKTDDEMIERALAAGADLISIDSPLSLPRGRTSYFDDDPMRDECGITRLCERQLKKRGVNSYPTLIKSMQMLTKRGVELAAKFRKLGVPVIESYPGAAQDVMSIPRKQAGLKYLTEGMAEFGIVGEYTDKPVSHDELDAITSAIVGQFFWAGLYEGMGDEEEGYLIIPCISAADEGAREKSVILLSGDIAAGKTTAAEHLARRGFATVRFSQVLEKMLAEQNRPITRSALQDIGARVHEEPGQRWLGMRMLESLNGHAAHIAVDGIRFKEDVAYMKERFGPAVTHIHIEADEELRARRINGQAREDLDLRAAAARKTESEVRSLASRNSRIIGNNADKGSFYAKIDAVMGGV